METAGRTKAGEEQLASPSDAPASGGATASRLGSILASSKRGWKRWALLACVVLLIVIVLQNTEEVSTRILFIDLRMPRALLLFVAGTLGGIVGSALTHWVSERRRVE